MNCRPNFTSDLIPVDTVANALIAIAWQTARKPPAGAAMQVYNITTGDVNPTTWEKFLEYGREIAMEMPSLRMVRLPAQVIRGEGRSPTAHKLTKLFSETLFSYLVDLVLLLIGQKPM